MGDNMAIREMEESDRDAVMRIFNYYAVNSFAAYPDSPLPPAFFANLREGAVSAIVLEYNCDVAGFGLLKPFFPFPPFRKSGMLTYFLAPDAVGRGLGTQLLRRLTDDARKAGMKVLMANMSSRNEGSIRFHQRQGFVETGHLVGVGEKFGEPFDMVWMQRPVE
jgi:L-amino acid N-acyltransferase YncA